MKKVVVIVSILLIIVVIIVLLLLKIKQSDKIINASNIESLDFHYTQGYMINSDIRYELKCKGDCILIYKPLGISYEEAKTYKVSSDVLLEIEYLLNKYKVFKWNGFHGNDKNVLDGDSFGFFVSLKNGESIEASGYMSWPDNYYEVRDGLDTIFDKIVK